MHHVSLIDRAMAQARQQIGLTTKEAAAPVSSGDVLADAADTVRALEFLAIKIADDGTPEGAHGVEQVVRFLETSKTASKGRPAESLAPTGTQAVPPRAGSRTSTPYPAGGDRPQESLAPTGTQTTIGQAPPATATVPTEPANSKKASGGTLFDMVMQYGSDLAATKEAAQGGPADTIALDGQGAPPAKNENTNLFLLHSNEAPVAATKRQAKKPTRARLKQLFASASDTGPGQAAARAAFPQAMRQGGGIKEAAIYTEDGVTARADAKRARADAKRARANASVRSGQLAGRGAVLGGAAGGLSGGAEGAIIGALAGGSAGAVAGSGGLKKRLANAGVGALQGAVLGGAAAAPVGAAAGALSGGVTGHKRSQRSQKRASLADLSDLAKRALNGDLGAQAQDFLSYADGLI